MLRRVLFVGLGSAGQRHLRNLTRIVAGMGDELEVMAYRHHKSERVFDDHMKVISGETLQSKYNIKEYKSYEAALDEQPDFVVIANPNSMHMQYALEAAKYGIDMFVEKPISVSIDGVNELKKLVSDKKLICQVGFNHRYNCGFLKIKDWWESGKIGEIVSADFEIGECISKMHPYEDYRTMIEARKDLGGGVVLCQCHELDLLFWLFGYPQSVYSIGGSTGIFDTDVEEIAESLFCYETSERRFSVRIHQDYLQTTPVRKVKIIGTKGIVIADLLKLEGTLSMYGENKVTGYHEEGFERNSMFIAEMKTFIRCVDERLEPDCNIESAIGSLIMGLAIRESMATNKQVMIHAL